MIEQQHTPSTAVTSREQELELEVARLTAELEALRGADPTAATSRFLSMAAATVDQAVADARREADEIAEEISSAAEARRDEATRIATEAEATAERLQAEADRSQEIVDEAKVEAESIRTSALEEVTEFAESERLRVEAEIETLTEVRESLEQERGALESYHEELSRRVQDMAESMMAFMTTEPPILGDTALAPSGTPELGTEDAADDGDAVAGDDETDETDETQSGKVVDGAEALDDPAFTAALARAIEAEEDAADEDAGDEDAVDAAAESPTADGFAGVPVIEDPDGPAASSGLFDSATPEDSEDSEDAELPRRSLFSAHGARYVAPTSTEELAEALEDDSTETDEAFQEFLTGDGEPDPSRDWLLRPEQF